jgi:hypothetical protein
MDRLEGGSDRLGTVLVEIGYNAADGGFLAILVATALAGLAVRRHRRAEPGGALSGGSFILVTLLLVGYLVAVWAMTTKPT